MSYLAKTIILLCLSAYAIFMDYMENPEKYEVVNQILSSIANKENHEITNNNEYYSYESLESPVDKAIYEKNIQTDNRLSLSYDLKQYSLDNDYLIGNAVLTNNTNKDLYFYYSNCRNLNDYLKVKDTDAILFDGILSSCCFPSAIKDTIKANSKIEWDFSFFTETEFEEALELEYTFVELTANADFHNNSIYLISEDDIKGAFVIQGKPTKIQKIEGRNPRIEQLENLIL